MADSEFPERDDWFLLPRASDEMELTQQGFKAFSRIYVYCSDCSRADEAEHNNELFE